jgi:Antibiotic biosynthesis monooxygenase
MRTRSGLEELEKRKRRKEADRNHSSVRARIHPGKEDEFERFVRETGVPMAEAQGGCSHVEWSRSRWSERPEFVVVTHWDSLGELEAFACPRWQEPVISALCCEVSDDAGDSFRVVQHGHVADVVQRA